MLINKKILILSAVVLMVSACPAGSRTLWRIFSKTAPQASKSSGSSVAAKTSEPVVNTTAAENKQSAEEKAAIEAAKKKEAEEKAAIEAAKKKEAEEKAAAVKPGNKGSVLTAEEDESIFDAVVYYIPNRLLDLADIFTIEIGAGANGKLGLHLTRYLNIGAGYGPRAMIGWDYARQYGAYTQDGGNANFIGFCREKIDQRNLFGTYKSFLMETDSIFACRRQNQFWGQTKENDISDPWAIGVDIGILYNAKVMFHPVAVADFICGLFFIDFEDDDI